MIPSFGGYSADTTNTELADSCASDAIAKVYENLARTYHVSRIDLDVEANSLPGHEGRGKLLGTHAARVVLQPHVGTVQPAALTDPGDNRVLTGT